MLAITTQEQIDRLRSHRAVISVYLDRGYNTGLTEIILSQKGAFDRHVNRAWHALVPVDDGGYVPHGLIRSEFYNYKVASIIIDENKIPTEKLPAMLFRNYGKDSDNFYISFNGQTEQGAKNIIGRVGDIIRRQHAEGRTDPDDFRHDATDAVKRDLRLRSITSIGERALSPALSALGLLVPFF